MPKRVQRVIHSFTGDFRFLSNFTPCPIEYDKVVYPSVEHAYQAAKTEEESDRIQIANAPTPGHAKQMGRKVKLRDGWEDLKIPVMEYLLSIKFSDPTLRHLLLATDDCQLIEGNTWGDRFWGIYQGQGRNELGKLLMKVRQAIRDAS